MKTSAFIVLFAAILNGGCTTSGEPSAEKQLRSFLAAKSEAGNVFAQGTLDGIDYRKLLRGEVAKHEPSLTGIFRYTAYGKLMGEGAEDNCVILRQLLRLWGDPAYARVLAVESPKLKKAVIDALDYTWPYPGWRPAHSPKTYCLAPHDQSYRQ